MVAVADVDDERCVAPTNGLARFDDYRALLDRPDVDGVVIATPNVEHYEMCSQALEAGKHTCVEKPLTIGLAHATELEILADRAGRVLFTGFHRRYNRSVVKLKNDLVDEKPTWIYARYCEAIDEHIDGSPWYLEPSKCGGGCVADNGPNLFDTLRFLVGPVEVLDASIVRDCRGNDVRARLDVSGPPGCRIQLELDWTYPGPQAKDVTVWTASGRTLRADFVAGYEGLKGSLPHEYIGLVSDFVGQCRSGGAATDLGRHAAGAEAAGLVDQAYGYEAAEVPAAPSSTRSRPWKRLVRGRLVGVLEHVNPHRGMQLIPEQSRCLRAGELHELVVTTDREAQLGRHVEAVGFLGFVEMDCGGVVERGDELVVSGRRIGRVLGFDDCHYPNHYNIVVQVDEMLSGRDLRAAVEDSVFFTGPDGEKDGQQRRAPCSSGAGTTAEPAHVGGAVPIGPSGGEFQVDWLEQGIVRFLDLESAAWEHEDPSIGALLDKLKGAVVNGGKRLRPRFCYWAWYGAGGADGDEQVWRLCAALELLHTLALIHDDIMDQSATRRGEPALYRQFSALHRERSWKGDPDLFGTNVGILAGDLGRCTPMSCWVRLPPRCAAVWDAIRVELRSASTSIWWVPRADRSSAPDQSSSSGTSPRSTRSNGHCTWVRSPEARDSTETLAGPLSSVGLPLGAAFQLRDDLRARRRPGHHREARRRRFPGGKEHAAHGRGSRAGQRRAETGVGAVGNQRVVGG